MTDSDTAAPSPPAGVGRTAILVLLPFAGGYFLSYLYRTVNSVIGDDLIRELGLSASDIGLLTAVYLLTFALFQLPLGVLLDRYGPRRVNATLMAVAAAGALIFSVGDSRTTLLIGRALIGLGVSAGLMASFKTITQWFPEQRWPLVNGCFLAVGGLGAIAGTAPVQAALDVTDWRGVFLGLSIATICVSGLLLLLVPERSTGVERDRFREQLAGLLNIYRSRVFVAVAPVVITTMAANLSIQGLWAGLWLRDVAGLGRTDAAAVLALLNVGLMSGFVGLGLVSDILVRRGVSLATITAVAVSAFCLVQAAIVFELDTRTPVTWILFGLLANASIFCYPLLAGRFPLAYTGRANTAVNLTAFAGAFAAQYAIGGIIDLFPRAAGGNYVPDAYQAAFGAMLALQVAGFLWFLYAFRRVDRTGGAAGRRSPSGDQR